MKTKLNESERIVKEGLANMQRGLEAAGGKLFLTNQRLIFEAHFFNFQRGVSEIPLSDIQSVEKRWAKFIIPLFPNALAVCTGVGKEYKFILQRRETWANAIAAIVAETVGTNIKLC